MLEYDASGLRTKKIADDVQTKFYYSDGKLLAEKRATPIGDLQVDDYIYEGEDYYTYSDETNISYLYGASGLTGFTVDRLGSQQTYYYQRNLQGDITHIYDANGELKAEYAYDAWGNFQIVVNEDNIANINPFRYRGYYFDTQTGLYYLKSRYYDSEVGRFINADAIEILSFTQEYINGLNLYAYCINNPVMFTDSTGMIFGFDDAIIGGIVALIALFAILFIENQTHIIERSINALSEALQYSFNRLVNWISSWGDDTTVASDPFSFDDSYMGYNGSNGISLTTTSFGSRSTVAGGLILLDIVFAKKERSKNRRGVRVRGKSRKDAKEKARKRGNGKPPRHDDKWEYNEKLGKWIPPHFHPGVGPKHPFYHDHYFYSIFFFEAYDLLFSED